jgi:hypothetical protein
MNSRMNEDLAWLRVQDMQREAENRRLMASAEGSRTPAANAVEHWLRVIRKLTDFTSRRTAAQRKAPSVAESRHHA